jgi:hypothetical protein
LGPPSGPPGPGGAAYSTCKLSRGLVSQIPPRAPRAPSNRKSAVSNCNFLRRQKSFLDDFGRGCWAFRARDVEIQQVVWRHSKMLLGGNVALSCGNARMAEGPAHAQPPISVSRWFLCRTAIASAVEITLWISHAFRVMFDVAAQSPIQPRGEQATAVLPFDQHGEREN